MSFKFGVALRLAYSRVRITSNNNSKNTVVRQRRGIDDIIKEAFSAKADCHSGFNALSLLAT